MERNKNGDRYEQIPHKATIVMQKKDLTLLDAWGIWLKTIIHLESPAIKKLTRTNVSNCLLNELRTREKTILNNSAMIGALYLDPRYRNQILKDEQLSSRAIHFRANLHRRISSFRLDASNVDASNESSGLDLTIDFNDPNILDKYLSNESNPMETTTNTTGDMSIGTE